MILRFVLLPGLCRAYIARERENILAVGAKTEKSKSVRKTQVIIQVGYSGAFLKY